MTCGLIADKADDEELSQAYLCVPATTRFDEQLFLDDLPMSNAQSPSSLSRCLMDRDSPLPDDPQSGHTSSLFMDEELDCTDDFQQSGGNCWGLDSDCEEGQCHMHRSGLPLLPMSIDLHEQRDCDISSAMMDFSDSDDSYDLLTYQLQKGHQYRNLNTAPRSIPYYVAHDHATGHADGISQDNSKQSWPG